LTVYRCERIAHGDVDRALATVGPLTLARRPDGVFVEAPAGRDATLVRALAFAGVRTVPASIQLAPVPAMRPAIGRDLSPLPLAAVALDLVHVRPLPLAAETKRLLRRSLLRRSSSRRRLLCRQLLHGDDATLAWRRRAWSTKDVLRSPEGRRALRPVVFDATALVAPPEHRVLASDGALARWLFG
jgi:hypothetical protein